MNNTPLTTVEEHDNLGVRLHHHMSWKPHIDRICNKANQLLGFLRQNLSKSPTKIKKYIFTNSYYYQQLNTAHPYGTLSTNLTSTF